MKLLDLFCGAGGAGEGYRRAGFEVTGVDIRPMPRNPHRFIQADALEFCREHGHEYDFIHASPPCQAHTIARNNGCHKNAPALIPQTRAALTTTGKPFAIENVKGAPLHRPVMICGSSFGLGASGMDLPRHRFFEVNFPLLSPPCQHRPGKTMGVYGNGTNSWHRKKIGRCLTVAEMRQAMEIDWMTRAELSQAIPPAYTEFIGRMAMRFLQGGSDAYRLREEGNSDHRCRPRVTPTANTRAAASTNKGGMRA